MNLGAIYIRVAIVIIVVNLVLGSAIAALWLKLRRNQVISRQLLLLAVVIGPALGSVGLIFLQQPFFSTWHRLQNEVVPTNGCISYEPSFWHLYATYRIDRQSFDRWVASHPWGLTKCKPDEIFQFSDGPHFGITSCEAIYESPRGPKGNNLRVYYQHGIAYLSYSAM